MRYGYVYILCSQKNGTLYIGVTSDLAGRLEEHKSHFDLKSFTATHNVTRLVWFERYDLITDAIAREKTLKKWKREWKIALIEKENPEWREIILGYDDWGKTHHMDHLVEQGDDGREWGYYFITSLLDVIG